MNKCGSRGKLGNGQKLTAGLFTERVAALGIQTHGAAARAKAKGFSFTFCRMPRKHFYSGLLGGGTATAKQTDAGIELSVAKSARDPMVTTVELTMDAEVNDMIEASKPKSPAKPKPANMPPPREEIPK